MARKRPLVAIDGPAGAGKSTVTRQVAAELGYLLLGTGSLYRVLALAARRAGVAWTVASAMTELAEALVARGDIVIVRGSAGEQRIWLSGTDVTDELYGEDIGRGASEVSAIPGVRGALLEVQRAAGREGGVVAEGRDIGTVVFPDAEAKFYLTASVEVRSERRWRELLERGLPADLDTILREVAERDDRDRGRAVAPLCQAPDAELVDSSHLDISQVVERIVRRVRQVEESLALG